MLPSEIERDCAKRELGDLILLVRKSREMGCDRKHLMELHKRIRCQIAYCESMSDQLNADLRDFDFEE